ncbi:hypothetical protein ACPPVS_11790 [Cellulomonas sp. McL0617]|uniref:hypothetical protein n=1 Tax=Cellulomonas sp. McL0617 TaxID=3415675 RepID=UPI003CFAA2CF
MPGSRPRPSTRVPLVAAVVVLALGALVAVGVGQALGLSFRPADTPAAIAPPTSVEPTSMVAAPRIATISVPAGERLSLAASAVSDALVDRGLPAPTITTGDADLSVRTVPSFADSPEAYRVRQDGEGHLALEAAGVDGAAAGLYGIADRIRSGAALDTTGATQQPRLGLRLTDSGSVGREADPAAFSAGTDYSLNTDVVAGAVLPEAPWVDQVVVDRIDAEFKQLVQHDLREGYNGIVVPGFLEYVTFSGVGDGHQVYPQGDPHVARAQAMVKAFGPVFRYAADMGMHVYLLTDMLAVSPPLEAYLQRTVGGLDVDDPALWSVYQAGLAELFDSLPFVDGLMVRIGEGGAVYQAGWDYSSKLAVTSQSSVQAMLKALLATASEHDRDIIFRTWTVGVGAIGDLHTDPASYESVFGDGPGGIDDPHLIVSTKYTMGDFYSHLPLNPTLSVGNQRRIVEFQARREFEGFGALPNDLVAEEAQALQTFLAANPHVEGVWNWTQDGGPLRAGPMTLYLRTGFWQMYDLNTYGTARLAWDPSADPTDVTRDWVRQTLSADPATAAAITDTLGRSRDAITTGLYIRTYAKQSVKALGLEPPPMMWIFEWDIVTGDSAALDSIYAVSRTDLDSAVADGAHATDVAAQMRAQVAATDPATWRDPALYQHVVDALDYETDLLGTLAAYRESVLRRVQWLDTGSSVAYDRWRSAEQAFRTARAEHEARYAGDVNLPAYNFTAADLGAARADRDPTMAWLARGLLVAVLLVLVLGAVRPRSIALHALFVATTRPWRLGELAAPPRTATVRGRVERVLVWAVPAVVLVASRLVYTWFAAPAHLVLTLGSWLILVVLLRLMVGRRDPFHLWAALGGVVLLRTAILLAALVVRGPGRYWFGFWTDPAARTAYVTVAFAAFCWSFVVIALVLRRAYGLRPARAVGLTLLAGGLTLALASGGVAVIGLERALTIWNDQMALLPWGLSRILGITVYLGIPTWLPAALAVVGLVVALAGVGTALVGRRTTADARADAAPSPH